MCKIENIFMQILNKFNKLKPEFLDSISINLFIIRKCITSGNVIFRHKPEHGKTFSLYCDENRGINIIKKITLQ